MWYDWHVYMEVDADKILRMRHFMQNLNLNGTRKNLKNILYICPTQTLKNIGTIYVGTYNILHIFQIPIIYMILI